MRRAHNEGSHQSYCDVPRNPGDGMSTASFKERVRRTLQEIGGVLRLPRLKFNSLAARLIAAAAVWTIAGLLIGGLVLSGVFRAAVQDEFDERLAADLGSMIAAATLTADGQVSLQGRFKDPRFERIYSGSYWEIVPDDAGQPDLARARISRSLFDSAIRPGAARTARRTHDPTLYGNSFGPYGRPVRFAERKVIFPATGQKEPSRAFIFLVAGDLGDLEGDVARFNRMVFEAFVLLGAGLIGAVFIQVRVGLKPLRKLSLALARIRDGKARRLEGRYPAELAPLAEELNGLIEHSTEVVARARTHASNLAHALKTPLSVLASEAAANPGPLADAMMRQVEVMRRHIDHHLMRARAAGAQAVLGVSSPVAPVLGDLGRVLRRIHSDRGVQIAVYCPDTLSFRGERQDLEEMAGNLMDNACKWAHSQVRVRAALQGRKTLVIAIADDGPGLTPQQRARVGERGERLDESVPGSGLGLAIARDIAKLYGGNIELATSDLGGLEARLVLPAVS